jgi:hypothetical protein
VRLANDVSGTLPIANGGTGATSANDALNALLPDQSSANGKVLTSDGTNTSWAAALTSTLADGAIFVGNGSNVATAVTPTGDVTLTNAGVTSVSRLTTRGDLFYRDASAGARLALGTSGKRLRSNGTDPLWGWNTTNAVASADYTITDTDGYDGILVTTGASDRTITLPAAANNSGRRIFIKKVDSGSGGVAISGTIDGGTSNNTIKAQYGFCEVISDGSSWYWLTDIQESGTWTPAAGFAAGSATQTTQVGYYTRNGRTVMLGGLLQFAKNTGTGAFTVYNLPFANRNASNNYVAMSAQIDDRTAVPANYRQSYSLMTANSSVIQFYWVANTTTTQGTAVLDTHLGTGTIDVIIGGTYRID